MTRYVDALGPSEEHAMTRCVAVLDPSDDLGMTKCVAALGSLAGPRG